MAPAEQQPRPNLPPRVARAEDDGTLYLRARRRQLLPPPRNGPFLPRRLEHVPQHVSSGLVRAQQLLRPLRLLERILDYCVRMVLAATMQ